MITPRSNAAIEKALAGDGAELRELCRQFEEKNARMGHALQVIMDEAQLHHEHNPISKVARLPIGYRKILNIAHCAIGP